MRSGMVSESSVGAGGACAGRAVAPVGEMNALDRALARVSARGPAPFMVGHVLDFPAESFTLDALRARVAERAHGLAALGVAAVPGARAWTRTAPPDAGLHVGGEARADGRLAEATDAALARPLPGRPAPDRPGSGLLVPGWDLRLLGCRSAGVQRLCFRVEHAVTDGVGAAHLLAALLADGPVTGPYPYRPVPGRSSAGWLRGQPFGRPSVRRTVPAGSEAVPSGPAAMAYADVPDARLRAVAARWGVGVNDVHLASVAGALAASQRRRAGRVRDLRVVMPMSVRTGAARLAPGNAALPAIVRLPCGEPRPERRLADVAAQSLGHKESGLREGGWRALCRVPPRLLGRTVERAGFRLAASSVHLNGAYRVFGASLLAGGVFALNSPGMLGYFSLTRTAGTARVTVVHDPSLAGAADLPGLWVAALDELAAP
ncbi:condensation protein [Streptomyces termitum]|uniref:Condensation protein n=2 Tax=Streptomyces termitum TaxID=67368 RepID=A0A918WBI8_9ACTN|nr:condensation protein [Streptomyces termitum]